MAGAQAIRGGKVAIEIGADLKRFYRQLNQLSSKIRNMGASLSSVGTRIAGVGIAAGLPFAAAAQRAAAFEDTMAAVAAISGAAGDEFEALKRKAQDLGATTSFTAQQAAEGLQVLAQGGFSVEESLNAIDGVLALARTGMMDLGTATDFTVSILRAFKIPAENAGRVADVLAKAATSSNATISDLGASMTYVASIASSLGVSVEEVAAMLGTMADRGIKGSIAGTGLRRIFMALSQEGDKLKDLGVEIKDPQTGKLRPVLDIIADLKKAMEGMDATAQLEKLSSIFDVFGANAIFSLMGAGTATEELLGKLQGAAGTAARVATAMDDTLGGSMRMAMSAAEALALAIGDAVTPVLRQLLGGVQAVAAGLADWVGRNKEAVVAALKIVAVATSAGLALVAVGGSLQVVGFAIGGIASALAFVLAPLSALASVLPFVAAAFTAVGGAAIASATGIVAAFGAALTSVVTFAASGIAPFVLVAVAVGGVVAAIGRIGPAIAEAFGDAGSISSSVASLFDGFGEGFAGLASTASKAFSDIFAIAKTTLGGIYDAIVAGELGLAFEILWAGLKTSWLRGSQAVMAYVDSFVETIQNVWDSMQTFLAVAVERGLGAVSRAWMSLMGYLPADFQYAINKVLDIWDYAVGAIQKAINYIRSFFDKAIDYKALNKQIDDANKARKADRDSKVGQSKEKTAEDIRNSQREEDAVVAGLNRDREAREEGRRQRTTQRADDRQAAIDQTQSDLNAKVERAGAAREAADIGTNIAEASTLEDLAAYMQRLQQLFDQGLISESQFNRLMGQAEDKALDVDKEQRLMPATETADKASASVKQQQDETMTAGTFSAMAAMGMGLAANFAERTAKAAEETARNTRDNKPRVTQ